MGLLAGGLIFILGLYFLSSFVWFVEVTGNERVDRNRILISASRHGIYVGAGKWTFSRIAVEEAMLRELNELTYIQCNISGVKATIKVVEKILPEENITEPCNLVARRDGVVDDVLVLQGQANVKHGEVVAKGDILISGIITPTVPDAMQGVSAVPPEPYSVRARGVVKARTWYEGYGECSRRWEEKNATGKTITRLYLITPWSELIVKGHGEIPFALYNTTPKTWLGAKSKWGIRREVLQEQVVKITEYTEEQAVTIARRQAMENLRLNMGGNLEIKESHMDLLSRPSDSIVRLKIAAETIEEISVPQLIESGEISN
jgi:similar to stage IV sporulation protein